MRSRNRNRSKAAVGLAIALAVVAAVFVTPALAEPPFVSYPKPEPTSLRWILTSSEHLPHTEYSTGERDAIAAAQAVLSDPPWGLVRNADHGYAQCAEMLARMRVLRDVQPTIAGHEVVLAGPNGEVRVFVYNDGVVRFLSTAGALTPSAQLRQIGSDSERHAWEVAHSAMCPHAALEPDSPFCDVMGSIAAYGVGLAAEDGTRLIIRVDHDDGVSCTAW